MAKSIKVYSRDKSILMEISSLEREAGNLVIKGKIMGSMPMAAVIRPEEARNIFSLLNVKLAAFLLTFLLRRAR